MLTDEDLEKLGKLMRSEIGEFYDKILLPHFERIDNKFERLEQMMDKSVQRVADNEVRIKKLEVLTRS